jgi:hypothetical protein
MIPPPGHGDISWCCLDLPAVDKPNPSSLGQENPSPIQLETLRVSKGIDALAFFLEPGKPLRILFIERHLGSLVEKPHGLLQSLRLRPGYPDRLFFLLPAGESPPERGMVENLLPGIETLLL